MKECTVEDYLVSEVKRVGGVCIKLTPPPKGIQDRLVLLPGGFLAFVELKRPVGGIIAKLQKFWGERVMFLGQRHYNINSLEMVDMFIQEWQNFLKRR